MSPTELLDDFERGLDQRWVPKIFQGETEYRVVAEGLGGGFCLRADSRGSASGLVLEKEYRLQDLPWLSWRWKVENILPDGNARTKAGDDYAARIYVVFPHWFFPKTRTLNYIWANQLPINNFIVSPYTGNSMMIAVESGSDRVGEWRLERRNVLEDYRQAFGEEPPPVGAIAIMTDADNTGGTATAWYDDIIVSRD
jgi:hypothetical protein